MAEGSRQGIEEECVEEEDGGTLGPAADGICAHRIRGHTDHGAQRKEDALGPVQVGKTRENGKRGEENEEQGGDDVGQGEGGMRGESVVEAAICGGPLWEGEASANRRLRTTATAMTMQIQKPMRSHRGDLPRVGGEGWERAANVRTS